MAVPHAYTHPTLDGELGEHDWNRALRSHGFLAADGKESHPYSEASFLWDEENLYLGLYAADQNLVSHLQPGGSPVEGEDIFHVVLFLADGGRVILDVAPSGVFSAERQDSKGSPVPGWKSQWQLAADRDGTLNDDSDEDEEWVIEAALPWSALGVKPAPGTEIGMFASRCDTPKASGKSCGSFGSLVQPVRLELSAQVVVSKKITLPGSPDAVGMDYLAFDAAHSRVWAPAGNTGNVDVIEADDRVTAVGGFPTVEREMHGQKRKVGPSSIAIGSDAVFVGSRADASLCRVDEKTLTRGACITLPSAPDGMVYVNKEIWVTAPQQSALLVVDAEKLVLKATIVLPGKPEGYAVDEVAHQFLTNLEDKDLTLVVDIPSRKILRTLHPGCGEEGPRGLVVDELIYVACTDHLAALDAKNDKVVATLPTGLGLDNIAYVHGLLYAVAGKDARLTVAAAKANGKMETLWTAPTTPGTRVVVADDHGNAYVADSKGGAIWKFSPP